jgi:hypothetical protein
VSNTTGDNNDNQSIAFHVPDELDVDVSAFQLAGASSVTWCNHFRIQYSNNCDTFPACSNWQTEYEDSIDFPDWPIFIELDTPNGSRNWRLLCYDWTAGGSNRWWVSEWRAFAYAPEQADTATPTITPTPSDTPTPTPQYRIEITSTAGSPMYIERRADFGDVAIFFALLIVAVLLAVLIFIIFWRRPQ